MGEHSKTDVEVSDGAVPGAEQKGIALFSRVDLASFWTAFAVSLTVYVFTMAPTVTLGDSGVLVVAADHLGVPYPPGFPV
jgi:hypothetical protein